MRRLHLSPGATDIDTLMQQADAAMYMAKQAGRSTHRIFSAEMNGLTEQRLALIAALRRAIAEGKVKGDEVSFIVTRERNGQQCKMNYKGKVEGDTIKEILANLIAQIIGPG